jgi:hypothetical protein
LKPIPDIAANDLTYLQNTTKANNLSLYRQIGCRDSAVKWAPHYKCQFYNHLVGKAKANPMFDTQEYTLHIFDSAKAKYTINVISKHHYFQGFPTTVKTSSILGGC